MKELSFERMENVRGGGNNCSNLGNTIAIGGLNAAMFGLAFAAGPIGWGLVGLGIAFAGVAACQLGYA